MYLNFYGLREEPFGVTPDPRFLYRSPTYCEAQATLEYGIRSGRGFTALVARPGMGKTTLLFHLLEQYSATARTAFIFLTQCDSREFMRYLMAELGADTQETDFVRLQDQFGQLLVREAQAGRKVIAVVDEAQNLDLNVLETVRLLSDFETPRAKLLHIILTGQPELADKLASPSLLQLRQRISHLVRLEPLSDAEVKQYIAHRLRVAGYSGRPLFTPEAHSLIVQRSEGIPRTINNLCFNALSLGCALQRRTIDGAVLAEVSADLNFETVSRGQQEGMTPAPISSNPAGPAQKAIPASAPPGAENPLSGQNPACAAAPAQEETPASMASPAASGEGEEPAAMAPVSGPVLVPGPQPLPAYTGHAENLVAAEMGNLALHIESATVASQVPAAPVSPLVATEAAAAALGVSEPATPPNGSGVSPSAESSKPVVDVDALASDCALLEMEAPKRWKKPVGMVPPVVAPPLNSGKAPGPKPVAGIKATAAMRPPGNGAFGRMQRRQPAQPPITAAPRAGAAAAAPPTARMMLRKRRSQRSLYLAGGASLLLLLILVWLLGSSGSSASPSTVAGANVVQATESANSPTSSSAAVGDAADNPANGSVMDVVEDLPRPGEEASSRDTNPAVVMRGSRDSQRLLRRVDPVYPAAARLNRIQGPVVLEATIGAHGFLRHIRVLSGDPLLSDSVLDAVRGWRYQPRLEHGRPVETTTRIVVNFQLISGPRNSSQHQ